MRWALVIDDVVVNVIVWDGESAYTVPAGDLELLENDSPVGIGWTRDGDEWVAPLRNEEG